MLASARAAAQKARLPAGRVADRHHVGEVEPLLEPAELVDPRGHVLERRRPAAAAAPAQPAVLEVPDRPAAPGEVGHETVLEPAVVAGAPEAAVDEHGHGVGRRAVRGQRELAELIAMRAVRVRAGADRPKLHCRPLPGA